MISSARPGPRTDQKTQSRTGGGPRLDLRNFPPAKPTPRTLRPESDYFERNAARMRYPRFRKQGLFYGSGVIEAGCKMVIGSRLSSPECSDRREAPTRSSLSAAPGLSANSRIIGLHAQRPPELPTFMSHTHCGSPLPLTVKPRVFRSIRKHFHHTRRTQQVLSSPRIL